MMFLRLIGALLVALSFSSAGYMQSDKLRRRLMISRSVSELLMKSGFQIRTTLPNVYELCSGLRSAHFAEILSFISYLPEEYTPDIPFSEQWITAVMRQKDLPPEEKDLLIRLGSGLGQSDQEGQLRMINGLLEEAKSLSERRQAEYLERGKLYRSVGTLAGLMAAVLMI